MRVELIDHTADPEATIGKMAAICYDSNTEREACIRRAAHCKDSGHLATLRFAYATFSITGISRVCSHQLVRVAHAGILQRSQRYVKETRVEYVDPPALADAPAVHQQTWRTIQIEAENLYLNLVNAGHLKKEDARYILPQGCTTAVNMCMNFQGWRDFLANRTDKAAQWEIREVANEIQRQLAGIAPKMFGGKRG